MTCSSPGIFHIPRCTCVSICACACFHKCVCVWVWPHTADTYISCWVRCSLSSFIVWKPTLECFSSSFITVQTHRMEFTWHDEDAVKTYKSLPALCWLKARLVTRGCYTPWFRERERQRREKTQTGTEGRVFCHIVSSHSSKGETLHQMKLSMRVTRLDGETKQEPEEENYRSSRQKHESTSNKQWRERVRQRVRVKKPRWKTEPRGSGWVCEKETEQKGGECVVKKGVRGNVCSGKAMKQYTTVWKSLFLSVWYKVAAVLLPFPPITDSPLSPWQLRCNVHKARRYNLNTKGHENEIMSKKDVI